MKKKETPQVPIQKNEDFNRKPFNLFKKKYVYNLFGRSLIRKVINHIKYIKIYHQSSLHVISLT